MSDKKPGAASEVMLPIAPMLDMSFQLLFFFILNFNPVSVIEGQMELSLPAPMAVKSNEPKVDPNPKADKEPEVEAELTVLVRTQHSEEHKGQISDLRIQRAKGGEMEVGRKDLPRLIAELQRLQKDLTNKTDIMVQADSHLMWSEVVDVMDACRQAGFTNVGFQPPPDYQPGS
ncbi:MAG TPA: biopolymer transporter ExbD [Gemmataceae bacterium]|nr:biopolymer transporter ExbD [Gemmataceae bacterium]